MTSSQTVSGPGIPCPASHRRERACLCHLGTCTGATLGSQGQAGKGRHPWEVRVLPRSHWQTAMGPENLQD